MHVVKTACALWMVLVVSWFRVENQKPPQTVSEIRIVSARLRGNVRAAVIEFVRREIVVAAETVVEPRAFFCVDPFAVRTCFGESFVSLRGAKPADAARWIETELHDFSIATSNVYDSNDVPTIRIDVSWERAD